MIKVSDLSYASNVQVILPKLATSKPSTMTPRKKGLSKACGGLTKSSLLCVIARLVFRSHQGMHMVLLENKHLILDPLLNV